MHEKKVKKTTSVSFAFTHTYNLEKLTLLLFFPKRTWKILKNVQNAKEKNISFHYIVPCYLWYFMVSLFKGRLIKKGLTKCKLD